MKIQLTQHTLVVAISLILLGCGVDDSKKSSVAQPIEPEKPTTEEPTTEEPTTEEPTTEEPTTEEPTTEEPIIPRPDVPVLSQQACDVSFTQWKKIRANETVQQTVEDFSCNGFLSSIEEYISSDTAKNVQEIYYTWGTNLSKPRVVNHYVDGKLSSKEYYSLESSDKGNCSPSEAAIEKLKDKNMVGTPRSEIETILGCTGIYDYSISDGSDAIESYYIWREKPDSQKGLMAIFDQDDKYLGYWIVEPEEDSNVVSSTCQPTYDKWGNVSRRDALNSAETKLGCAGVNSGLNDKDESIKGWGKSDGSTDRIILELDKDKYVIAKHFYAKYAISSCLPSLANWQSAQIGDNTAEVSKTMQCNGVLKEVHTEKDVDFSNSKYLTSIYNWTKVLPTDKTSGPLYQMYFAGDKLFNKIYTKSKFSTCTPDQKNFIKLEIGNSWDSIKNIFGCSAEFTYGIVRSTNGRIDQTSQYSWGVINDTEAQTYAYVTLDKNNKLMNKYINFSPK